MTCSTSYHLVNSEKFIKPIAYMLNTTTTIEEVILTGNNLNAKAKNIVRNAIRKNKNNNKINVKIEQSNTHLTTIAAGTAPSSSSVRNPTNDGHEPLPSKGTRPCGPKSSGCRQS